jgi:hypothetical protein
MAKKKNQIDIDVVVDDKGTTKKLGLESKKTAKNLDKVGTSASTADRNIKGAAQASSSGTKNFSKMAQGAGGLVGVYATLAATAFAVSAAFNFLKSSMDFRNLLEGQKALGAVTGVAYKTISNSLVEATNGQLKYAEAAKAAAIGTASGISPSQLARLGSAAKNASVALGRDLGDSFDRLIRGVTKAEPELLDELGIILRLENATNKYGLVIGKAAGDLNEFERSQAVANEVLEQAERKFGAMEKMMDPVAFSLNQFSKAFDDIVNSLKSGIAGPLAGIAGFLANNMLALSGAVALFAGGLLKQVLPSMSAWKESSQATAVQVGRDQKATQLRLERTKRSYEKLKLAQMDTHALAKKGSSKIVTGVVGGTQSGQGALDYFKGDTDSKKSRAAADKALKHAESQVGFSAKKRTGLLRAQNDQQVKDLRASYAIRSAVHKKGMTDFKFHLKQGSFAIKGFKLQLSSMAATAKVAFATLASAAATAGRVIGRAFFWISMLSIAYEAISSLVDYLFPATEASKKLARENEELADKYSTLAEEIERTNEALKDNVLLTVKESIVAKGNAAGSLDAEQLVQNVNKISNMDKGADGYQKAYDSMLRTAEGAADLDSKYKILVDSLKNGTEVTDKGSKALINYSNALQQAKINMEQLPSKAQAANTEMVKLIGTINKPFGTDLIAANRTLAASAKEAANDMVTGILELQNKAKFSERDGEDYVKKLQDAVKQQQDFNNQSLYATALADAIERKQTNINRLLKDQIDATVELETLKTQGITNADKLLNIGLKEKVLLESVNDELAKKELMLAKKEVLSAKEKLTEGEQLQLDNLLILIAKQDTLIDKETQKARFALEVLQRKKELLEITRVLSGIETANLSNLNAQTEAQRRLNLAKAGGSGTYGVAQGREISDATQTKRLTDLAVAINAAKKARTDFNETMSIKHTTTEYNTKVGAMDKADSRVKDIRQEIDLYERRNELALLSAKGDTEALRLKVDSISLNPAMTAFNVRMNELRAVGTELNAEAQKQLYAEIAAQTMLGKLAEQKAALFDGIASSMSSAFASIVTGTASAKQAFASMATSILTQIAQMITEMMVMRLLMSAFGMPAPVAAPTMSKSNILGQIQGSMDTSGRTGGVFSQGQKMQGYATGGVARGSTSGYPATLHGTEAVVPLPNGRSIPVEMKDSGGTNNNIVVNITSEGQSSTQGSTGPDMDKMGSAVAKAVQVELQNQKRSGGILNPYGVA